MFLKSVKIMSAVIVSTSLFVMPMIAKADLTVVNYTTHPSTSVINNGMCSRNLPGGGGVTPARDANGNPGVNVVPTFKVNLACITSPSNCKGDVYVSDNCTGPVIATVIIDTKSGIKSIQMRDGQFNVSANGFTLTLNEIASL